MVKNRVKSSFRDKNRKLNFQFIELYNNYFPIVYSQIFESVKNEQTANIISEEIFVELYNNPEVTEDRVKLTFWLNKSIASMLSHYC